MKSFQNIVTKAIYGYNLAVHEGLLCLVVWYGNLNFSRVPLGLPFLGSNLGYLKCACIY